MTHRPPRFRPVLPFLTAAVVERYWRRISMFGPDECWPWTGQTNNRGYGRLDIWTEGRHIRLLAHRVAVTLSAGSEIGEAVLMHSCDNPPCCNPAHLSRATQADNMQDALRKGRSNLAGLALGRAMSKHGFKHRNPRTHCKRGHEFTPANTKLVGGGRACRTCNQANGRTAYRMRAEAAIRAEAVSAACRGETVDLSLWERRAAIDQMIQQNIPAPTVARTLGVPRRTVNGRRARMFAEQTDSIEQRSAA
jgi:hypothetical protein